MSATQVAMDTLVSMAETREATARTQFLAISDRAARLARYCDEVETGIWISPLTLKHLERDTAYALQLVAEANVLRHGAKELGR